MSTWTLLHCPKFSSSAVLASLALLFAACDEAVDSPGTMTGGAGGTAVTGSAGSGVGSGGGSAGTSGAGASSAGNAGATAISAGASNAGTGSEAGTSAGFAGVGGTAGGSLSTAGNGGGGGGGAGGTSSFQPCPANAACKIMPFGDSITQGYDVAGGYRAPLFHLALAAQRDITFVGSANDYSVPTVDSVPFPKNHEGHGGYTIEGGNGIAKFVDTSMAEYEPHIITLMIGTNDINGNNDRPGAPNRLGKLLDAIFTRAPNILVVLAQIVPTRTDATNTAVESYNAAMPDLVAARVGKGQHIVLVNMYGAFEKEANYKQALLADNLHPNQAGYNVMADVWFQALSPYLP